MAVTIIHIPLVVYSKKILTLFFYEISNYFLRFMQR